VGQHAGDGSKADGQPVPPRARLELLTRSRGDSELKGIAAALDALERLHGKPPKPLPKHPLDWILWENVAYLVGDEEREAAYRTLEKEVGLSAEELAGASAKKLLEVARLGGMHPERRVDKLREIAELRDRGGEGGSRRCSSSSRRRRARC
jgi:hypothetical protein